MALPDLDSGTQTTLFYEDGPTFDGLGLPIERPRIIGLRELEARYRQALNEGYGDKLSDEANHLADEINSRLGNLSLENN